MGGGETSGPDRVLGSVQSNSVSTARCRTGEEIEQAVAGETVAVSAGFGEFEQVQGPVSAPVDDVIAAVLLDL